MERISRRVIAGLVPAISIGQALCPDFRDARIKSAHDGWEENTMPPALRLYEDVLSNGSEVTLTARPRMIFVVHGSITVAGRTLQDGEAWSGEGAETLKAGSTGAALWRWDLVSDGASDGAASGNAIASGDKVS